MDRRMLLVAGIVAAGSAGVWVATTRGNGDGRRPGHPDSSGPPALRKGDGRRPNHHPESSGPPALRKGDGRRPGHPDSSGPPALRKGDGRRPDHHPESSGPPAVRSDLDVLFRPDSEFVLPDGVRGLTDVQRAGALRLPTGRLIAADPSWLPDWPSLGIAPYTTTVPAGTYPVTLALVKVQTAERRPAALVAAAKLTIRDAPVSAWQLALRPGEDPAALADDEFFGVGVDVATVCLFDATVLTAMARKAAEQPQIFDDVWLGDRPFVVVDAGSKANLIAFQSGYGDGFYPVWIGRTTDGHVACFVVDMLIG